jgi:CheY-like chemotaxis protein/anti-sigma regulatory factor (Ser/Thr protein kinase)
VPLGALLDQIAAESRPLAESKGLAWRLECEGGPVSSDPALLGRLIRNLVQNAIRYTECGTVAIEGRRDGDRVALTVRDTGIGIPGDRLDDIFGEFVQLGNPGRDRSQGLGLGLAIVRRIAGLLGHAVAVRSESGRGSAFTVTLPAAPAAPLVPTVTDPGTDAQAGVRGDLVVVVDDDVLVRMGVTALLERWGWRVLAAGCLRDALDGLDGHARPAAVIADYRLGGGETGIDVLLTLRARLASDFVAVLLTGDTAPECRGLAERHGIAVMHKPVASDDLKGLIGPQPRKAAPEPALVS